MEITRIAIFEVGWHTLQEFLRGRGKEALKKVSNSSLVIKCHFCLLPKDCEGMSVIVFCLPLMCSIVRGQLCCALMCKARTRMSCSAIRLDQHAIRWTQLTVGLLSLKSATPFSVSNEHTCSIMSHKRRRPAISKSEFVRLPPLFLSNTTDSVMSSGHCSRNTVGRHSDSSPMMTPPEPKLDALHIPT
jgi:hypothetical protein